MGLNRTGSGSGLLTSNKKRLYSPTVIGERLTQKPFAIVTSCSGLSLLSSVPHPIVNFPGGIQTQVVSGLKLRTFAMDTSLCAVDSGVELTVNALGANGTLARLKPSLISSRFAIS